MNDRLKRLYYLSHHRGMKENDVLMGRYAENNLTTMSDDELNQFEALLEEGDNDLFSWIMEYSEPPEHLRGSVLTLIINFRKLL